MLKTKPIPQIKHLPRYSLLYPVLLVFVLCLSSCSSFIAPYDLQAYENATSLKAEVLITLDKATTSYQKNQSKVESIQLKAQQAYEYAKGIPKNSLSAKQWQILNDPQGDLLGKVFKRWQERDVLSQVLIDEYKIILAKAFDEIICLEINKDKPTECFQQ